jgi:hypothetical protein
MLSDGPTLPDEELTRVLRRIEVDDVDRAPIERVFAAVDRERRSRTAPRRRILGILPLWVRPLPRTSWVLVTAVAVLVLAVASGLVARLPGVGGQPGASVPPSPTLEPVATFVSPVYGYSIDYPVSWLRREAERQLDGVETPWDSSPAVDYLAAPRQGRIIIGAARVEPGTTLEWWTASTSIATCGEPSKSESIEIDGEPGTLSTFAVCNNHFHQWLTVIHGTSAWHIVWLKPPGTEDADRDQFLLILGTFRFPEAPLPTPVSTTTPAPTSTPGPT